MYSKIWNFFNKRVYNESLRSNYRAEKMSQKNLFPEPDRGNAEGHLYRTVLFTGKREVLGHEHQYRTILYINLKL